MLTVWLTGVELGPIPTFQVLMTEVLVALRYTVRESVALALACSACQFMFKIPSVGSTIR